MASRCGSLNYVPLVAFVGIRLLASTFSALRLPCMAFDHIRLVSFRSVSFRFFLSKSVQCEPALTRQLHNNYQKLIRTKVPSSSLDQSRLSFLDPRRCYSVPICSIRPFLTKQCLLALPVRMKRRERTKAKLERKGGK